MTRTILVTRPKGPDDTLTDLLLAGGMKVLHLPLIELRPIASDDPAMEHLNDALSDLSRYDWLIFASTNAVKFFFHFLKAANKELDPACKIAAVGTSTALAIEALGHTVDLVPLEHNAQSLVKSLIEAHDMRARNVLWPRTDIGLETIRDGLYAAGATVDPLIVYRTSMPRDQAAIKQRLSELVEKKEIDAIALTSGQAARNLAELLPDKHLLDPIKLASIGPATTRAIERALDRTPDIQPAPQDCTASGLAQALLTNLAKDINQDKNI